MQRITWLEPVLGSAGGCADRPGADLHNKQGKLVGALGVSGDTSCGDHNIAWKSRHALDLDYVPNGPQPAAQ